jgi:anti-anti-sigma factor
MNDSPMQLIRIDAQDGVPVVAVQCSELRADSMVARLEQELETYLASSGVKQLVLDLSAVHFMSSSGLRVLILLRRKMRELGGRFTMCGVHEHVASVFKTTRLFSESFDYVPDAAAAAAALKAPRAE